MLGYLSVHVRCSEKRTVFREHSLRKTVGFEIQTMSKDRYASIFSCQLDAIAITLQVFFTTCALLKIREYHLGNDIPQF